MSENGETLKPMTGLEKFKAGVRGFFHHAVTSIPRVVLTAGAIFVSAKLAGTYGGEFGKGIADMAGVGDGQWATVGKRVLWSMGLGTIISGGIGAAQTASQESEQRNALIELQKRGVPVRGLSQQLTRQRGGEEMAAENLRPSHLPTEIAHHLSAHMR